jgi:hypothetical protein
MSGFPYSHSSEQLGPLDDEIVRNVCKLHNLHPLRCGNQVTFLTEIPVCMRIYESDRLGAALPDDIVKQHEWTEEVVKAAAENVGNGKEPVCDSPGPRAHEARAIGPRGLRLSQL